MDDLLAPEALVSWLQRFVRYPSEQTQLLERDPAVLGFIRECVSPLMQELGLEHCFDAMGNLLFQTGPLNTGRSLLFVAYAMTHPAANMADPFSAKLIDTAHGKAVRGRGVAEQKSALAAALGAVADATRSGALQGRLMFVLLTAGETGRHDAIESATAEIKTPAKNAIICIGTGNKVAIGNKGRVDFDITVKGKATHSSTPWNGVNALDGAWRILEQVEHFELKTPPHPKFGRATLTATAIESRPRATHTIQDTVRVTCDRRLLPGEDPDQAYREIIDAIVLAPPWRLEWARGPAMYPNEISVDGLFYGSLSAAFQRAAVGPASPLYCNFALDAGFFGRRGVEAAMLGPGHIEQFHSNDEYVRVVDVTALAHVYRNLIDCCLA
jgi:acetylornithine deacetylase/succinyl-diaminopimelate desuccinylase-like protein